jgi:large subunit ribosomal protein L17
MLTRKFGRKKDHRDHMLRNLAASVILYEKVETTEAKGKEIKKLVDRSINIAKKNTLAARRELTGLYFEKSVVDKLFDVLVARLSDRNSGYLRVLKLGNRAGDNANKVLVTFVEGIAPATAKKATKKTETTEAAVEAPVTTPEKKDTNDSEAK